MLKHKYSFEAIGTKWSIESDIDISSSLKVTIQKRIEQFDKTYSRFRKDSFVTKVAQKPGKYIFPEDAKALFDFYRKLYEISDGKVTPLIGDMIARAGYDANYSLKSQLQRPIARWEDTTDWDGCTLVTTQPVTLDVGAAGKGYLIDIIADLLDKHSLNEYVIDGSGDLRHKGRCENKVGLEHPLDLKKIIGVVDVQNKSFCASATNRRAWGDGMHHIFDPDTMAPTQNIIATWVIADDALTADGLATALFFTDPKMLRNKFDYQFVRMYKDGGVDYSPYFEGKLF